MLHNSFEQLLITSSTIIEVLKNLFTVEMAKWIERKVIYTMLQKQGLNLVASRYDIIRQVEKQCIVNEQFASIESKLHHGTKVLRAELDEIDRYLSTSKEQHGDGLFTTYHPSKGVEKKEADREVDEELNVTNSKRSVLSTRQTQCPSCGMKMLKSFTACHALVCSVLNDPDQVKTESSNVEYTLMMEKISVRPHPPRNLKVTEVSFSSVTLI